MPGGDRANVVVRGWRNVREAGARRLVLTALMLAVALLLARFSWNLPSVDAHGAQVPTPVTGEAERALYDYRVFRFAPSVGQDPRVLMVVYDDQTLIAARKRSPLDRGLLAKALRSLDTMGAKAIGIDILFDQPQDEDAELIATLRAMKTPVSVAYADAAVTENDIQYEQQQYLEGFLSRLEGSRARPASVMFDDSLGVTRLWPPIPPRLPPVLGRAMLASAGEGAKTLPGYQGAIRYRHPFSDDQPVFAKLKIDLFASPELLANPALAAAIAPQVAGRYVLIGVDVIDVDRKETPFSAYLPIGKDIDRSDTHPPGIEIHATMLAQMLDGAALSRPGAAVLWLQAMLVVLAAALTGMLELRTWKVVPLMLVQLAAILGLPFLLQARGVDTYGFPSVGPALGWVIALAAVTAAARASTAVQRRFAQGALGKYLPREMAEEIIERPELLALHGEKKQLFVLFSDLEGFTKMSHAIPPEMVATLLNRYLDMLSEVVLEHGGVIDKFVGDAVVAFWGAPIARDDDGERAARCGYAIWQAGEEFRNSVGPGVPPIGKTRVGLHWGEAVVGNFGGKSRIQYTALGDSMNTAARLEAASKPLDSSAMASREFAERSRLDWWRPMGRVVLRGRARPVDLYEPAPEFPAEDRAALEQAIALIERDIPAAIAIVAGLVEKHPTDTALANLLHRTRNLSPDRAFVLG
jgi:adenylate cyclase